MIKVQQISRSKDLEIAFHIRQVVFVEEQGVSREEEYDLYEDSARHFLAWLEPDHIPSGTARWRFTDKGIKLERFAVLPTYRHQKVGSTLVQAVLQDIQKHPDTKGKTLYLHAQIQAVNLYLKHGFRQEGEMFEEAGIQHYKMIYGG